MRNSVACLLNTKIYESIAGWQDLSCGAFVAEIRTVSYLWMGPEITRNSLSYKLDFYLVAAGIKGGKPPTDAQSLESCRILGRSN